MRALPSSCGTLVRWAAVALLALLAPYAPHPASADHNGCTPPPLGPAVCNVTGTPATAQQGGNLTVGWQGASFTEYSVRVCKVNNPGDICVQSLADWVLVDRTGGTPGNPSSVTRAIPACLVNGFYKARVDVWLGFAIDTAFSNPITIAGGTAPCVTNVTFTPTTVGQGFQQTVRWSASNQASYAVFLTNTQGTTVQTIQPRTTSTSQQHTWTVPFSVAAGTYKIRVQVWNSSNVSGEALSNGNLTVTASPQIFGVNVSPTSVQTGAPLTITWSSTNQNRYEISRCNPDGSGCNIVVFSTTSPSQSATWQVPTDHGTGTYAMKVKVTSTSNATAEALSGPFSVKRVLVSHQFADTNVPESSGQTFATVLVKTSDATALTAPVTVHYTTVNGTAQAGSDYTAVDGTLTFQAGTSSNSVMPTGAIPILNDTAQEPTESFRTSLDVCGGCALDPTRPQYWEHAFNILDDDAQISIGATPPSVLEGDGPSVLATFTVSLGVAPSQPVTVSWATVPGTARPDRDYRPATGSLTFPPGLVSRTMQVEVLSDLLDEDDETFHVDLGSPVNGRIVVGRATVAITDNDATPTVSVQDCPTVEGNEGVHDCVFRTTLSAPSGRVVTITAATANDTAIAPADYTAVSSVLTFPEETTVQNVPVSVNGDLSHEPNERYFVRLSAPVNVGIADGEGIGTITNDDGPPTISIRDLSVTDRQFRTVAHLRVELSVPSGFPVSVGYVTRPGTATERRDYLPVSGILQFTPGIGRRTVDVPIVPDLEDEGVETFTAELSGPTNATIADGVGVASITDRPRPPACAARLDPAFDGTPIPVDLVLSEVAPGSHIELYNPGTEPIILGQTQYRLMAPPSVVTVAGLASGAVAPARGYVTLRWPDSFPRPANATELVLYRDAEVANPQKIMNYVCWLNGPTDRKDDAEQAHKWSGDCADQPSAGAIHRLRGTEGTSLASFDTVSTPSPRSCAAVFTVTRPDDPAGGTCGTSCSLRQAVEAANAAPGPDTILLPGGILRLQRRGAGEDQGQTGDLDLRSDITIVGTGSTVIDNGRGQLPRPDDRLIHVHAGAHVSLRSFNLRGGVATEDGGAIFDSGELSLSDVEVRQSDGLSGGALAVSGAGATAFLRGVTLANNHALGNGGGLAVLGAGARADVRDSTFSLNGARGNGGALFHGADAAITLNNVTITGNRADEDQDQAGDGGGTSGEPGSRVRFANTVLTGNTGRLASDCDGSCGPGCLASDGHNFVGSDLGCGFPVTLGDQVGTGAPSGLGPLADNGGPTRTHAVLAGSPLLDAAHVEPPGSGGAACAAADQRGWVRPWPGEEGVPSRCDIGSFESCHPVFDDVPEGSPFHSVVTEIYCRGISGGCASNPLRYCPGAAISRAGMAVFLVVALGEAPSGAVHDAYFADVRDDGFAPFINRLYELGITGGCGGGNFCPDTSVSRGEMAVFLVAALEEKASEGPDQFQDIANHPFRKFINRIAELGITTGCGNGNYCPDTPVSREEMAAFLRTAFFSY